MHDLCRMEDNGVLYNSEPLRYLDHDMAALSASNADKVRQLVQGLAGRGSCIQRAARQRRSCRKGKAR
jgi:hypothetical protein